MAMYYFDASALVKYYVPEPGSAWVRQLLDTREPTRAQALHLIIVAEITRVEVAAGLAVVERIGRFIAAGCNLPIIRFATYDPLGQLRQALTELMPRLRDHADHARA